MATTAVLGYLTFFAYFVHPLVGKAVCWLVIAAVALSLYRLLVGRPALRPHWPPLLLMIVAGWFYIAALLIYPAGTFSATAQTRFFGSMPGDNQLPQAVASAYYGGNRIIDLGDGWLSSDRPPLQSGIALLLMPLTRGLGFDDETACATAGVWFQLLWLPAVWTFFRWLGLTAREALGGCAALVFTGFLLFYSTFVWPKLCGAAFVLSGFCILFDDFGPSQGATSDEASVIGRCIVGGGLMALGCLSHGGVIFSVLPLAAFSALILRHRWKRWLAFGTAFLILAAPWLCYQRFYAPPGNRLVKWHFAGVIPVDSRSVSQALHDSYAELGWAKALEARRVNLDVQRAGDWRNILNWHDGPHLYERRLEEASYPSRTTSVWIFLAPALLFLAARRALGTPVWRQRGSRQFIALAWLLATIATWVGLTFYPLSVLVHQGSLAAQLLMLGLLASWGLLTSRIVFALVTAVEVVYLVITWFSPSSTITPKIDAVALALCAVAALAIIATFALSLFGPSGKSAAPAVA
jgi:hypothetical protein